MDHYSAWETTNLQRESTNPHRETTNAELRKLQKTSETSSMMILRTCTRSPWALSTTALLQQKATLKIWCWQEYTTIFLRSHPFKHAPRQACHRASDHRRLYAMKEAGRNKNRVRVGLPGQEVDDFANERQTEN